jgi:hypothetical protein
MKIKLTSDKKTVGSDVLVRAKVVKISRDGRPEDAEFTHCVEIDGYNKWVRECDLVPVAVGERKEGGHHERSGSESGGEMSELKDYVEIEVIDGPKFRDYHVYTVPWSDFATLIEDYIDGVADPVTLRFTPRELTVEQFEAICEGDGE